MKTKRSRASKAQAPAQSAIEALTAELREQFKVAEVASEALWCKGEEARCARNVHFVAQHHFDIKADLLVFDPLMGTVGLVRILAADDDADQHVRSYVDQAAYLRHLLIGEAEFRKALVPSVELVLILPFDRSGTAFAQKIAVGLQDTIADTDLLDGVGVNTLGYRLSDGKVTFDDKELSHAFAWLLYHTREWLDRQGSSTTQGPTIVGLETENFRTYGHRKLDLRGEFRIHVVHGQNGSGKSSIAEAIEFAITGRLRRLGDTGGKYAETLRNRHAPKEARASVKFDLLDEENSPRFVEPGPIDAYVPNFDARAMILDQATMDDLTRAGDAQRAATLLGAFFPEDYGVFLAHERAKLDALEALEAVPEVLHDFLDTIPISPDEIDLDLVSDLFAERPEPAISPAQFAAFLELTPDTLKALLPQLGEFGTYLAAWLEAPPVNGEILDALDRIDVALAPLRSGAIMRREKLDTARKALKSLAGWSADGAATETGGDLAEKLNRWLRLHALADLADRRWVVARTLEQAKPSEAELIEPEGTPSQEGIAELDRHRIEWRRECEQAHSAVLQHNKDGAKTVGTTGKASKPTDLRPDEIAALDETGEWLEIAGFHLGGLGDRIRTALKENRPVTLGAESIGTPGWADNFLAAVERCSAALSALRQVDTKWLGGRRRHDLLVKALAARAKLAALEKEAQNRLAAQLQKGSSEKPLLGKALTELTYLITPARWAYDMLNLELRKEGGVDVLAMTGDDEKISSASRLNAAELYSVAIAMFLLCARRPDNPLKLLVLDDPFQNMDELTVSTVARGIGRLVRLWQKDDGWRLLILLHRESDVRRFVREAPCIIHRLPWLSPDPKNDALPVVREKSLSGDEMLNPGEVMVLRKKKSAATA